MFSYGEKVYLVIFLLLLYPYSIWKEVDFKWMMKKFAKLSSTNKVWNDSGKFITIEKIGHRNRKTVKK